MIITTINIVPSIWHENSGTAGDGEAVIAGETLSVGVGVADCGEVCIGVDTGVGACVGASVGEDAAVRFTVTTAVLD